MCLLATKLSPSFLGADEGPLKSMISDLIVQANDSFNGRLHLQHLEEDKNPPKGLALKLPLILPLKFFCL